MQHFTTTLGVLALLAMTSAAVAQTQETETPDAPPASQEPAAETSPPASDGSAEQTAPAATPEGQPARVVGSTYVEETHGDWDIRCARAEEGNDPCQLYQLLEDTLGNPVAEFTLIALPAGQEAQAVATVATPIETLLNQPLTIAVDGAEPQPYPYTFCAQVGCFVRIAFGASQVAQFRSGAQAIVSLVPLTAPDRRVNLALSLSGFTAGYDALRRISEGQ